MSRKVVRDTRHKVLARALHGRLFINENGRVLTSSGRAAHSTLVKCLKRIAIPPPPADAPVPWLLGIASCGGELSGELLFEIGRALKRWRLELDAEARRRPAQRRSSAALDRDRREVERLEERLCDVRRWQDRLAARQACVGAPYFLDAREEISLAATLGDYALAGPLPPLIAWQARLVFWLAGERASRRYLAAVTELMRNCPQKSLDAQIAEFQTMLCAWKERSTRERWRDLLAEMRSRIQRLSPGLVSQAQLTARIRGCTFTEHCDALYARCANLLRIGGMQRWEKIPAELAALVAVDGGVEPLPPRYFLPGAEKDRFAALSQLIFALKENTFHPAYDALLKVLELMPSAPNYYECHLVCELSQRGYSAADLVWAHAEKLLSGLTHGELTAKAARRLHAAFAGRGWKLDPYDFGRLLREIRKPEDFARVEVWLRWLGSVSPRSVTPRVIEQLQANFWDDYLPRSQLPEWNDRFAPCLAPVASDKTNQTAPLLAHIVALRVLAGQEATLPKSLRKLVGGPDRARDEYAHLAARRAIAPLDAAAEARWQRLEAVSQEQRCEPDFTKLNREAEQAFLLAGIEAMRAVVRAWLEAKCRETLGEFAGLIPPRRAAEFHGWIEKLSEPERVRLRGVLVASDRHGPNYKRELPDNQAWIGEAVVQGLNLDEWFAPPAEQVTVGRRFEIALADEPIELFQMGTHFQTCLSLGRGENDRSVLTNAHDANKQVLYAYARDSAGRRKVVGRKLIAIGQDFKLLGYNFYCSASEKIVEPLRLAFAAYCGRLAARCRIELADEGLPARLAEHSFWYDDGTREWPEAARAALDEERRREECLLVTTEAIGWGL